jgi:hypothetical protein
MCCACRRKYVVFKLLSYDRSLKLSGPNFLCSMYQKGMMETREKSTRIAGLRAEIWTQDLPNMKRHSRPSPLWPAMVRKYIWSWSGWDELSVTACGRWPWLRKVFAGFSPRSPEFSTPKVVRVEFVMNKLTLSQAFSLSTSFYLPSFIPLMLHALVPFVSYPRYVMLVNDTIVKRNLREISLDEIRSAAGELMLLHSNYALNVIRCRSHAMCWTDLITHSSVWVSCMQYPH